VASLILLTSMARYTSTSTSCIYMSSRFRGGMFNATFEMRPVAIVIATARRDEMPSARPF
jgi:hypothetical protein